MLFVHIPTDQASERKVFLGGICSSFCLLYHAISFDMQRISSFSRNSTEIVVPSESFCFNLIFFLISIEFSIPCFNKKRVRPMVSSSDTEDIVINISLIFFVSIGTEDDNENLFRVESFTIHPQYNDVSQDFDVAIITIVGTMTFSEKVSPVCLPFQHSPDTFGGVIVHVLGM